MWRGKHRLLGCVLLVSILQVMCWRSRPSPTVSQDCRKMSYLHVKLLEAKKEAEESGGGGEGAAANADVYGRLARAGSRPPSCVHKCGGCTPCTATQVPATTDHSRTQYANYEPEGWKCKCGSAFYNP
nr:PREDICTED: EPIDERMAL PATTERNING FACTOR-like protein 5 [Musa acuminata subsp. malaccensis]